MTSKLLITRWGYNDNENPYVENIPDLFLWNIFHLNYELQAHNTGFLLKSAPYQFGSILHQVYKIKFIFCAHSNAGTCTYMLTCKFMCNLHKQWSCCGYASVTINGASCFDAVIQTDCSALNLFLNPAWHTKASCTLSYQCKHLLTLMPLCSLLSLHKWRQDAFILSQHRDCMSRWKLAGLEEVKSALKTGTDERKSIIICRIAEQSWESKHCYFNQCSCFYGKINWLIYWLFWGKYPYYILLIMIIWNMERFLCSCIVF